MLLDKWITKEEFHDLTRPLVGLPVSRTWRGAGSAIFFELGKLTEKQLNRSDGTTYTRHKGEAGIMLEWSWRVERPKSVLFGSFSTSRIITNRLQRLQDLTVLDVTIEGRLPELVIQLSDGHWVHSFTTVEGQPEWCLFLGRNKSGQTNRWITSNIGKLVFTTKTEQT